LNLELFISKRVSSKDRDNFSGPLVRLAQIAIALGTAVMILSVSVLTGFQQGIRDKVVGFGAHIQVDRFDINASYETKPVSMDQSFYPGLPSRNEDVEHIQVFAYKAGIIKTDDQFEGVILKGIGEDFRWFFFESYITEGTPFVVKDTSRTLEVLISRAVASKLYLKVGDPLRMYFLTGTEFQPRGRRFEISGIYETGLEEFDKLYVIGDINQIRRLNNWSDRQASGFEIYLKDFSKLDRVTDYMHDLLGYDLNVTNVRDSYPQIFDWLKLLDKNVIVILILMTAVAVITMISTLLILILEKTSMIGILKSLGMEDYRIRKVFFYNAGRIIVRGLIWGNLAGLLIGFLQLRFDIIPLNQASYYLNSVPVNLDPIPILLINAGIFLTCLGMMVFPALIITRITPVKAVRFN